MLLVPVLAWACSGGNPENRASCGFAGMAGATMALEQLRVGSKVLTEVPDAFLGTVPARVVGYGTVPALGSEGPDGALLAYDGPGFPRLPGFGLIMVEDSADTFKGVLIYDTEPPRGLPLLGGVTDGSYTVPLYGMRVSWGAVSTPRCPLFGPMDTTGVMTEGP